jgi:DNA-binding transcriptional LysR family regulator
LPLEVFGAAALADVVAERFDAAVRFGHPSELDAARDQADHVWLATRGESRAACAAPQTCKSRRTGTSAMGVASPASEPAHWTRGQGPGRVEQSQTLTLCARLISDVVDTNRSLVLEGLGAMLGAEWRIHDDLVAGRLVRLLPDWSVPSIPVYRVRPPAAHVPAKVRAQIQQLRDALG